MKTQISSSKVRRSLKDFQQDQIKGGSLIHIKGGDGDGDEGDGAIGIEEIIGA